MTDRHVIHTTDHHVGLAHDHEHEHEHAPPSKLLKPVAYAILLILVLYGAFLCTGIPQHWTERTNAPVESKAHVDQHPPFVMIAPFAGLLLCIAFLPLIPATAHWWENNTK